MSASLMKYLAGGSSIGTSAHSYGNSTCTGSIKFLISNKVYSKVTLIPNSGISHTPIFIAVNQTFYVWSNEKSKCRSKATSPLLSLGMEILASDWLADPVKEVLLGVMRPYRSATSTLTQYQLLIIGANLRRLAPANLALRDCCVNLPSELG